MNCETARTELVAFHFGEIDEVDRSAIEHHLAGCGPCLSEYFAMKRGIEMADGEPAPAPQVQLRIRNAVALELGVGAVATPQPWWERPLAFGVAGLTAAAALFLTATISVSEPSHPVDMSFIHRPGAKPE